MIAIWIVASVLGLFFVQPAYYRLKSKGHASGPFISITMAICGFSIILAATVYPKLFIGALLAPPALWFIAHALPPKPGAPGDAYYQITFPCPKCQQSITFPREREGCAVLCPQCKELIRVPE